MEIISYLVVFLVGVVTGICLMVGPDQMDVFDE